MRQRIPPQWVRKIGWQKLREDGLSCRKIAELWEISRFKVSRLSEDPRQQRIQAVEPRVTVSVSRFNNNYIQCESECETESLRKSQKIVGSASDCEK